MSKKLVVVGGTGFLGKDVCTILRRLEVAWLTFFFFFYLGKYICFAGLNAGYAVTSLSRSGRLTPSQLRSGNIPVTQLSQIQWKQADVFDPATYAEELKDADAVVHSMGVIFENERYKALINGKVSVDKLCEVADNVKGMVWKAVTSGPRRGEHENPLKRTPPSSSSAGNNAPTSSMYQKMNRESAVVLAKAFSEAAAPATKPFIYISAEDHSKFVPEEYIESKRLAEAELDTIPNLRTVFLRPGFMVSPSPSGTVRDGLGSLLSIKYNVAKTLGVEEQTGSTPVLDVETVARAAIEAVGDESLSGPVGLGALHKYANEL